MSGQLAIDATDVTYRYGERVAVNNIGLQVAGGEMFALLGPNGGGKTTFFRLLSTLIPLQEGRIQIFGFDLQQATMAVRKAIGVVFQAPSLDKKLTVRENLRHQARLYGLSTSQAARREDEAMAQLGVKDRAQDLVETLSGGLRRRVELAKGLLHEPRLLLMDEPSTGLDPGARRELWECLQRLRHDAGVTVVLTTHLLEEAEGADRIGIMHEGRFVAVGIPDDLKQDVGGETVTISADEPENLALKIDEKFGVDACVVEGVIRVEHDDAYGFVSRLAEAFPEEIQSVTVAKPTLEDVFVQHTGTRFWRDET